MKKSDLKTLKLRNGTESNSESGKKISESEEKMKESKENMMLNN